MPLKSPLKHKNMPHPILNPCAFNAPIPGFSVYRDWVQRCKQILVYLDSKQTTVNKTVLKDNRQSRIV